METKREQLENLRQQARKLENEIREDEKDKYRHLVRKAHYNSEDKTYFFVERLSDGQNNYLPFGIEIQTVIHHVSHKSMSKPEDYTEVPLSLYYEALDKLVENLKEDVRMQAY